jgi:hypothetical protein
VLGLWKLAGSVPSLTDTREALEGLLRGDGETLLVAEHEGGWSAR